MGWTTRVWNCGVADIRDTCVVAAAKLWIVGTDIERAGEVACGTLVSGLGMAYLGDRNRQQAAESHFLAGLAAKLRVNRRGGISTRNAERVDGGI